MDKRKSPGFSRMKENMGPDAAELMRLDTLRVQEEALRNARDPNSKVRLKSGPKVLTDIMTRKTK